MYAVTDLKGNITFVCAHTANAAGFFPAIVVVTSNVTQKCQRRISRLFVSGVLCFKYTLRDVLHENYDLLMIFRKETDIHISKNHKACICVGCICHFWDET